MESMRSQILGLVPVLSCMCVCVYLYACKRKMKVSEGVRVGRRERQKEVPAWRQIEKVMKKERECL